MILPDFKLTIKQTTNSLTMTYKDQMVTFNATEGLISGWEIDDFITKCIKQITDTQELRSKLSGN